MANNVHYSIFSLCLTLQHGYQYVTQAKKQSFSLRWVIFVKSGESYLFKDSIRRLFFFNYPNLKEERISSCKNNHMKCYVLVTMESSKDICFKEAEILTTDLWNDLS